MISEALIEALKEMMRVVVLAIIPVLIDSLNKQFIDWRGVLIIGVISALRFIDSWLHETNKALPVKEQNSGYLGEKGITF